jgi:hypothetical protein
MHTVDRALSALQKSVRERQVCANSPAPVNVLLLNLNAAFWQAKELQLKNGG